MMRGPRSEKFAGNLDARPRIVGLYQFKRQAIRFKEVLEEAFPQVDGSSCRRCARRHRAGRLWRDRRARRRRARACRSASCCRTRSRPSAGCSSTLPTSPRRLQDGRRHGLDQQRAQRPARSRRRRRRRAWPPAPRSSSRPRSTTAPPRRSRSCSRSKGGKAIDYDRQVIGGTASVYVTFDGKAVGEAQANGIIAAHEGERARTQEPDGRRALGRPDRPERVLVQERQRRRLQPALRERRDRRRARSSSCPTGIANNAATIFAPDARQDEQQDPGRRSRRTTTSPARSSPT